ncbi:hypothetical protein [Hymenobacter actinosclerus]|uniref:Uncharacterized protein n=1 Tax=Hymenobacter actinosclerus TaxID=82805 RepID=A0A1I0DQ84_9BACT|nr:hypothetical protein [Hymenobacter actinosclerus]SET34411.1 hypothetical protein SAMN04487998_1497 [Hymenobacter actinosclerus]
MRKGKNKLVQLLVSIGLIFLITLALGGLYIFSLIDGKNVSQESSFNDQVKLPNNGGLQDSVLTRLKRLNLPDGGTQTVELHRVVGFEFEKMYVISEMEIDYALPCPDLPQGLPLARKGFCQFGVIYKKDGAAIYLRGTCAYDLMNLSHSFDEMGFLLEHRVEVVLPTDKVKITYSTQNGLPYLIEPVTHKQVVLKCRKMY